MSQDEGKVQELEGSSSLGEREPAPQGAAADAKDGLGDPTTGSGAGEAKRTRPPGEQPIRQGTETSSISESIRRVFDLLPEVLDETSSETVAADAALPKSENAHLRDETPFRQAFEEREAVLQELVRDEADLAMGRTEPLGLFGPDSSNPDVLVPYLAPTEKRSSQERLDEEWYIGLVSLQLMGREKKSVRAGYDLLGGVQLSEPGDKAPESTEKDEPKEESEAQRRLAEQASAIFDRREAGYSHKVEAFKELGGKSVRLFRGSVGTESQPTHLYLRQVSPGSVDHRGQLQAIQESVGKALRSSPDDRKKNKAQCRGWLISFCVELYSLIRRVDPGQLNQELTLHFDSARLERMRGESSRNFISDVMYLFKHLPDCSKGTPGWLSELVDAIADPSNPYNLLHVVGEDRDPGTASFCKWLPQSVDTYRLWTLDRLCSPLVLRTLKELAVKQDSDVNAELNGYLRDWFEVRRDGDGWTSEAKVEAGRDIREGVRRRIEPFILAQHYDELCWLANTREDFSDGFGLMAREIRYLPGLLQRHVGDHGWSIVPWYEHGDGVVTHLDLEASLRSIEDDEVEPTEAERLMARRERTQALIDDETLFHSVETMDADGKARRLYWCCPTVPVENAAISRLVELIKEEKSKDDTRNLSQQQVLQQFLETGGATPEQPLANLRGRYQTVAHTVNAFRFAAIELAPNGLALEMQQALEDREKMGHGSFGDAWEATTMGMPVDDEAGEGEPTPTPPGAQRPDARNPLPSFGDADLHVTSAQSGGIGSLVVSMTGAGAFGLRRHLIEDALDPEVDLSSESKGTLAIRGGDNMSGLQLSTGEDNRYDGSQPKHAWVDPASYQGVASYRQMYCLYERQEMHAAALFIKQRSLAFLRTTLLGLHTDTETLEDAEWAENAMVRPRSVETVREDSSVLEESGGEEGQAERAPPVYTPERFNHGNVKPLQDAMLLAEKVTQTWTQEVDSGSEAGLYALMELITMANLMAQQLEGYAEHSTSRIDVLCLIRYYHVFTELDSMLEEHLRQLDDHKRRALHFFTDQELAELLGKPIEEVQANRSKCLHEALKNGVAESSGSGVNSHTFPVGVMRELILDAFHLEARTALHDAVVCMRQSLDDVLQRVRASSWLSKHGKAWFSGAYDESWSALAVRQTGLLESADTVSAHASEIRPNVKRFRLAVARLQLSLLHFGQEIAEKANHRTTKRYAEVAGRLSNAGYPELSEMHGRLTEAGQDGLCITDADYEEVIRRSRTERLPILGPDAELTGVFDAYHQLCRPVRQGGLTGQYQEMGDSLFTSLFGQVARELTYHYPKTHFPVEGQEGVVRSRYASWKFIAYEARALFASGFLPNFGNLREVAALKASLRARKYQLATMVSVPYIQGETLFDFVHRWYSGRADAFLLDAMGFSHTALPSHLHAAWRQGGEEAWREALEDWRSREGHEHSDEHVELEAHNQFMQCLCTAYAEYRFDVGQGTVNPDRRGILSSAALRGMRRQGVPDTLEDQYYQVLMASHILHHFMVTGTEYFWPTNVLGEKVEHARAEGRRSINLAMALLFAQYHYFERMVDRVHDSGFFISLMDRAKMRERLSKRLYREMMKAEENSGLQRARQLADQFICIRDFMNAMEVAANKELVAFMASQSAESPLLQRRMRSIEMVAEQHTSSRPETRRERSERDRKAREDARQHREQEERARADWQQQHEEHREQDRRESAEAREQDRAAQQAATETLRKEMDAKISGLDGKVEGLQGEFGEMRSQMSEMDGRMEGLDEKVEGLQSEFGEMRGQMGEMDGRMEGLDGKVEGLDGKVEGLDGKVEGLDGKVDSLQLQISQLMQAQQAVLALLQQRQGVVSSGAPGGPVPSEQLRPPSAPSSSATAFDTSRDGEARQQPAQEHPESGGGSGMFRK